MLESPAILDALLARVKPAGLECVPLADAFGRILARSVPADRDSPACDVSAMDGYAVRLNEGAVLPVAFEVPAGSPAPALPAGVCARVMTGAPLPTGAEAVVPRERTDETNTTQVRLLDPAALKFGDNIRRQGENLRAGATTLAAGCAINPAVAGSLSLLGVAAPQVFKRLKIAVLVTGNEVLGAHDQPQPWQVRDANGPALQALLLPLPWIGRIEVRFVKDEPRALKTAIDAALADCDALLLTGGVSAGDLDFVPRMLKESGCESVFHKLAIRPGKPLLGALTADGRPIFGLPGNPVAVMTCARRFVLPALSLRAGLRPTPPPQVEVTGADAKTLDLTWFRPVKLTASGQARLIPTQGSGDPVGAAQADGFVEIKPGQTAGGWQPFFSWSG